MDSSKNSVPPASGSGPSRQNKSAMADSSGQARTGVSDGAAGISVERAVEKRLHKLKRAFVKKAREKAPILIAENRDKVKEWAARRTMELQNLPEAVPIEKTALPAVGPKRSEDGDTFVGTTESSSTALPLTRSAGVKQAKGTSTLTHKFTAHIIPSYKPPPNYVTWAYLKRNELARDHGKRMFYTDASGETVPASDEDEESMPWEAKNGAAVDFALLEIAKEFKTDNPEKNPEAAAVLEALSKKLDVRSDCISLRLSQLQAQEAGTTGDAPQGRVNQEVDEALDSFWALFCRRCRIYGCRLHGGGQCRPHQKPQAPPLRVDQLPCGPKCWRHDPSILAVMSRQMVTLLSEAEGTLISCTEASMDATMEGGEATAAQTKISKVAGSVEGGGTEAVLHVGPSALAQSTAASVVNPMDVGPKSGLPKKAPAQLLNSSRTAQKTSSSSAGGGAPTTGVSAMSGSTSGGGEGASGGGADLAEASACNTASCMAGWTSWERFLFNKAQNVYGQDCCAIARLIGTRSCAEVAVQVAALKESNRLQDDGDAKQGGAGGRKAGRHLKKAKKTAFAPVVSKKSAVVMKRFYHSEDEAWAEYSPCTCVGICGSDCSCTKSKNFCEKFCACSTRCINRFKGCKCTSQCKTRQCPCMAAGRECDPDLCRNCTATCDHANPPPPGSECCNMRLRLRQHMRIIMGESTIQGWGAFVLQECKKDEFLGEYTGDLITQGEADRRGRIYDKIDNSYLFNLNEQWVLDARQRGNKLRFANHSNDPNCKARIMLVDGDHRVAIFANKNISAGEELFYDYRYDRDQAPDWAQKD